MKTLVKIFFTIVLIPMSIIVGIFYGAVVLVVSPFEIFKELFNSTWGNENVDRANY